MIRLQISRFIVIFMSLCLVGCSTSPTREGDTENTQGQSTAIGYRITEEELKFSQENNSQEKTLSSSDKLPIITSDGTVAGAVTLKQVTHIGILDNTNSIAVNSGVKDSYSITLELDMTASMRSGMNLNISCEPSFLSQKTVIGESCSVGWSGFPMEAQLYDASPSQWIEVGIQPYCTELPEDTNLLLQFKSNTGSEYKDILLSHDFLSNVVEGPSLKTFDEEAVIDSINGGQFSLAPNNISLEQQKVGTEPTYFYNYDYTVKYLKSPSVNREVALFDSFSNNSLSSVFVTGLQGDTDKTFLYERNPKALRKLYGDRSLYDTYVTAGDKLLSLGESVTLTDNRPVPSTTTIVPTYIRFRVEFPEEASARTNEELLSFNGRYVVFQGHLKERELPSYKEVRYD